MTVAERTAARARLTMDYAVELDDDEDTTPPAPARKGAGLTFAEALLIVKGRGVWNEALHPRDHRGRFRSRNALALTILDSVRANTAGRGGAGSARLARTSPLDSGTGVGAAVEAARARIQSTSGAAVRAAVADSGPSEIEMDKLIRDAGMYPDEFTLEQKRDWLERRKTLLGDKALSVTENEATPKVKDLRAKLRAMDMDAEVSGLHDDDSGMDEDEAGRAKTERQSRRKKLQADLTEAERAERGLGKTRSTKAHAKLSDAALEREIKAAKPGTKRHNDLLDERDIRAAERFGGGTGGVRGATSTLDSMTTPEAPKAPAAEPEASPQAKIFAALGKMTEHKITKEIFGDLEREGWQVTGQNSIMGTVSLTAPDGSPLTVMFPGRGGKGAPTFIAGQQKLTSLKAVRERAADRGHSGIKARADAEAARARKLDDAFDADSLDAAMADATRVELEAFATRQGVVLGTWGSALGNGNAAFAKRVRRGRLDQLDNDPSAQDRARLAAIEEIDAEAFAAMSGVGLGRAKVRDDLLRIANNSDDLSVIERAQAQQARLVPDAGEYIPTHIRDVQKLIDEGKSVLPRSMAYAQVGRATWVKRFTAEQRAHALGELLSIEPTLAPDARDRKGVESAIAALKPIVPGDHDALKRAGDARLEPGRKALRDMKAQVEAMRAGDAGPKAPAIVDPVKLPKAKAPKKGERFVTLPDGTKAKRTSANPYTHAVVVQDDHHAQARSTIEWADRRDANLDALEAVIDSGDFSKLARVKDGSGSAGYGASYVYAHPDFPGVAYGTKVGGGSTGRDDIGLQDRDARITHPIEVQQRREWEANPGSYEASQRERIAAYRKTSANRRREAEEALRGPQHSYGVVRWSQRADSAESARASFQGPGRKARVVAVDDPDNGPASNPATLFAPERQERGPAPKADAAIQDAQAKQRVFDRARGIGKIARDLSDIESRGHADTLTMDELRERVRAEMEIGDLNRRDGGPALETLRGRVESALAQSSTFGELRHELDALMAGEGTRFGERADDVVAFDPKRMEPRSGEPKPGDRVRVDSPSIVQGDTVLERATVRVEGPSPAAQRVEYLERLQRQAKTMHGSDQKQWTARQKADYAKIERELSKLRAAGNGA
jgi:hypothetical protein